MEDESYKWFFCGGFVLGFCWLIFGIIWCLTIVGFKVGRKCFSIAFMLFSPYGKEILFLEKEPLSLLDLVWFVLSGVWLMLVSVLMGIIMCLTIVGFDYGLHCFKMVSIAIMPFDIEISDKE